MGLTQQLPNQDKYMEAKFEAGGCSGGVFIQTANILRLGIVALISCHELMVAVAYREHTLADEQGSAFFWSQPELPHCSPALCSAFLHAMVWLLCSTAVGLTGSCNCCAVSILLVATQTGVCSRIEIV